MYASATAEPARRSSVTNTNMRARAARLKAGKKVETLEEKYASLAHLKFEDAYAQAGGNRGKAHAAWKKAREGR